MCPAIYPAIPSSTCTSIPSLIKELLCILPVTVQKQCAGSNFPAIFRNTDLCRRRPASSCLYFWPPYYRSFPRHLWLTQRTSSSGGQRVCFRAALTLQSFLCEGAAGCCYAAPCVAPLFGRHSHSLPFSDLCSSSPHPPTSSEHPNSITGGPPELHCTRASVFSILCSTCIGSRYCLRTIREST